MRFLRTNTACRVTVGPFFDKTDGVTPETAITVTACKLTFMVDNSNVPTLVLDTNPTASGGNNDMVHVTGDDAGFYDLELTAANLNYLGRAMLALTDAATHCPVFHEFMILPAVVYDSMILGTDNLQVDTVQLNGTAQTGRDIGASVLLSSGTGTGQVKLSNGYVAPNWGDVGNPTTTLNLSGTTIATTQKVDVETIKTNAVVNGGTITFPSGATLASTTNITAGTITTVTNLTNAPTSGDLTATMKSSVTTAATAATPVAASVSGDVDGTVIGTVSADVISIDGSTTAATNLGNTYAAFETGTATDGDAAEITLRVGASSTNDFYKDQAVLILQGTGAGQTNRIISYNGTSKVATVKTTWAVTPDNTSIYLVIGRIG